MFVCVRLYMHVFIDHDSNKVTMNRGNKFLVEGGKSGGIHGI